MKAAVEALSRAIKDAEKRSQLDPKSYETEEELLVAVLKSLAEPEEARNCRLQAVELELELQSCAIHITQNLVLAPAIDRATGDWTICLGVAMVDNLEAYVGIPHYFSTLANKSFEDKQSLCGSLGFYCLVGVLLDSVRVDELVESCTAMGLVADTDGQLHLAFYAVGDGDPTWLQPHLQQPWAEMARYGLPPFDSEKGLDLLFADGRKVRFGTYKSKLYGDSTHFRASSGLKPHSIASDIREDLAVGGRESGSHLFDQLRASILEKTREVEGEANAAIEAYKKKMAWLDEQ